MKKVLKNNARTKKYLSSLRRMYIVAHWARYGTLGFAFTGKYEVDANGTSIPLVYVYDDHNGTCDNYYLRKITSTTSAPVLFWTQNVHAANMVANALNLATSVKLIEEYFAEEDEE